MPTLSADDIPPTLKPYIFYGVKLQWSTNSKDAVATCPWCTRTDKFSVNIDRGVWRCLVCNEGSGNDEEIRGGNITTFMRKLDELSFGTTKTEEYARLATDRRLLNHSTLVEWGLSKSVITKEWLIPGFNTDGKMTALYKYGYNYATKRTMLWPPPTIGHKLFGMSLFNPKHKYIYIFEGLWDALAFWEVAGSCKPVGDGDQVRLTPTGNRGSSLLGNASVLGIASNLAFNDKWPTDIYKGKTVILMCQNDHPKNHPVTKALLPPASWTGMQRIAKILTASATAPAEIQVLKWGKDGYDKSFTSGYDIRDHLAGAN